MHELGYAYEIVATLKDFMFENGISKISSVTVEVGEATGVVPRFLLDCWPAVTDDEEAFKGSKLDVKIIPAKGHCINCDYEFILDKDHLNCPKCGSENVSFINGYEFEISEIRGA